MPDWEITATTVHCDAVDDEVTLLVSADGTCRCTGGQKYARANKAAARALKKKGQRLGKRLGCGQAECETVVRYRVRLLGK